MKYVDFTIEKIRVGSVWRNRELLGKTVTVMGINYKSLGYVAVRRPNEPTWPIFYKDFLSWYTPVVESALIWSNLNDH